MSPILEEVLKFIVLGALGFIWRETRLFYKDVKQCKESVARLEKGFLVLANRDRKSFDFIRRILYELTNGQNAAQIQRLRKQIDALRESAHRADEYRKRREAGEPCEDCGDLDLTQLLEK
jgi:hypothetical protein